MTILCGQGLPLDRCPARFTSCVTDTTPESQKPLLPLSRLGKFATDVPTAIPEITHMFSAVRSNQFLRSGSEFRNTYPQNHNSSHQSRIGSHLDEPLDRGWKLPHAYGIRYKSMVLCSCKYIAP